VLRHVSSPLGEGNPRHDDISHGTTFLVPRAPSQTFWCHGPQPPQTFWYRSPRTSGFGLYKSSIFRSRKNLNPLKITTLPRMGLTSPSGRPDRE
jgi:hypothetical protein